MTRIFRYTLAVGLVALMLLNSAPSVRACGPSPTEAVFVFKGSPDLPFEEFANGKIGIVLPSFGRKTLVIAYRYLNGGSFTVDEQNDLILALKGKAPEEDGDDVVKAWIAGRKEFLKDDEKLPEIYTERESSTYSFFPNCTNNAFEVALQTLKDRAATYGAEDRNVRDWIAAQDTVFQNCPGGAEIPGELGAESAKWLRKDRDYQIAAAHFYALNFDEARARFEKISADADSPWQEIAGYLIARTLVRQASLQQDETKKREVYEQAEKSLQTLARSGGKYAGASKKLLALVKYHIHPEERIGELARALSAAGNDNLRQDLIDYVWLLDRFESRILKAEEQRKKKLQPPADNDSSGEENPPSVDKFAPGELIRISLYLKNPDGTPNYSQRFQVEVKHDTSEAEIFAGFEIKLGRKLNDEETKQIKENHQAELSYRKWRLSPIRKWGNGGLSQYEGCDYGCTRLTFDLMPEFLRSDDLSDWILTLKTADPSAYSQAFSKWRESGSPAWLAAALVKAEKSSLRLDKLIQAAERVTRDEPGFPTVAYHLIRLKSAMGQTDEARRLLDEIISWQSGVLPVSAQNQFLEERMNLAKGLNDFLKSAQRKPVTFYDYGEYGKLSDFVKSRKSSWNPEDSEQTKEEYEREVEELYEELLPWDNRVAFDGATIEIFNWHFPLQLLAEAARNPNIPDYLQRSLTLAVWTRAILLNNDEIALKIAPDVLKVEPRMRSVFEPYLKSRTAKQRHAAALYVLLKFPDLSPFLKSGIRSFNTSEKIEYHFEESWWCPLEDTEYNDAGENMPKVVPKPSFLTAAQLETARQERSALAAIGDGKIYLGKQALAWAKTAPADKRVPEALFIATQANRSYKFGCSGWDHDERTQQKAEAILRQRYPQSPWTAKLSDYQN